VEAPSVVKPRLLILGLAKSPMIEYDSEFIIQKVSVQKKNVMPYLISEKVMEKDDHSQ
jgi:hypothetical protein